MRELKAGTVWDQRPAPDNDAGPFGGFKQSGLGRELGQEGLEAFGADVRFDDVDHDARGPSALPVRQAHGTSMARSACAARRTRPRAPGA